MPLPLLQFFLGVLLCCVPMPVLRRSFAIPGAPRPRFYFSGRVAIFRIAQSLRRRSRLAILPEYICNVVHRAFLEAGFEVATYRQDSLLEPEIDDIKKLVGNANGPSVLCIAPLLGADGGQAWIMSGEGRTWRNDHGVTLVLDCCQDMSRLFRADIRGERDFAVVCSFNDKIFPGVMGAVAVTDLTDLSYRPATMAESVGICRFFVTKLVWQAGRFVKRLFSAPPGRCGQHQLSSTPNRFEYSSCNAFPYTLGHSAATRLQVAVGVAGRLFSSAYLARKSRYIGLGMVDPLPTPYFSTSAYILVPRNSSQLKAKLPYAIHGTPTESLRPALQACHFKGFWDID